MIPPKNTRIFTELVNILSSFFRESSRIIPQMLIITHHPEIEDVADVVYT
jgi:DNA repair exonuclease SbcCD ATPase subunit